ncbi:unnamed protein product [Toxocara canis]|uniref:Secreted protein n=1 Tax=Toxocara canis TaxID=6265 RepID=A0A183VGR0_TOXCA|nr:unnamed protein product [Toxocara canis]
MLSVLILLCYMVSASGFDPPTSGLWAQHASTAPRCCEWFRSADLWVMGPARFHCATVLHRVVSMHRPLGYGPSTLPLRDVAGSDLIFRVKSSELNTEIQVINQNGTACEYKIAVSCNSAVL